jgi:hypothetical protein
MEKILKINLAGFSIGLLTEGEDNYIVPPNNPPSIAGPIQKNFSNNLHKNNYSWQIVQKTRVEDILKEVKI